MESALLFVARGRGVHLHEGQRQPRWRGRRPEAKEAPDRLHFLLGVFGLQWLMSKWVVSQQKAHAG